LSYVTDVQARVEQARTMVQDRVAMAQERVKEAKTKFGVGNGGLGFGVMGKFLGGTSGQYRVGSGAVIDQLRTKARSRPMLANMMRGQNRSGMRANLANDPALADDVYEQNSRSQRVYSQDLSVSL
jgi:hypothetical protein